MSTRGSMTSRVPGWTLCTVPARSTRSRSCDCTRCCCVRPTSKSPAARAAWLTCGDELQDVAIQSADDALVAVLDKLDGFQGASRFTTWAYKFALLEAAVALRRRAWQGREVVLDPDRWPLVAETGRSPHQDAETAELLAAVARAVRSELTPHQREVLVAVTLDDVPIDVLAERLGSTRNALYKTLHDARRKLRAKLAACGLTLALDDEGAAR